MLPTMSTKEPVICFRKQSAERAIKKATIFLVYALRIPTDKMSVVTLVYQYKLSDGRTDDPRNQTDNRLVSICPAAASHD
jgi:hypothetical protein